MISNPETFGDAELTAYLDGELPEPARSVLAKKLAEDPAIAARLEFLRGGRDFRAAFDVLIAAAPVERLEAILTRARVRASARAPFGNRAVMRMAAAIVLFLAGGLLGLFLPRVLDRAPTVQVAEESANWRSVVADYLTLYTRETLASIPDDAAMRQQELSDAGARLALDLTPEKVALPDLAFKRAQLFQFNGKPLAQLAYLAPDDGPVAFCIIASGAPDAAPSFEQRDGQNIVFWSKGGRGYLIVGKTPRDSLETMAARLQASVS